MVSSTISYIARGAQFLFAIVIISLIGNMLANSGYNIITPVDGSSDSDLPSGGNPAEVNYAMFLGVWTLVSMTFFIPVALKRREEEGFLIAVVVLDGLNALFYMCDGIALAAAMGIHSCGNQDYIVQNRITNNSLNQGMRCREAQASTAFIWINFLLFVVTTVFSALAWYQLRNPTDDVEQTRGSSELRGPTIAVVDYPQQAAGGGMQRFWGHRAAPTGAPEVADIRSDDGRWGVASFIGGSDAPEEEDGQSLKL